jgi:hypothetical protein
MRSSGIALIAAVLVVFPSALHSATTRGPTGTVCPSISCDPPFCNLDYTQGGCPVCLCGDPRCKLEGCPPGQQCLPTGECPACYECLPKFGTTAVPDTVEPNTTGPNTVEPNTTGQTGTVCPSISCDPPFCKLHDYSFGGCPVCLCFDPKCMFEGCPDGQQCLPTDKCSYCYECLPKFEITSELPETTEPPTTTTTYCPLVTCGPGCRYVFGEDYCWTCDCPTCMSVTCVLGERCILLDVQCDDWRCYPVPTCVPDETTVPPTTTVPTTTSETTTTSEKTTTSEPPTTTTFCPGVTCSPNCRYVFGTDGCRTCDCPTCMGVTCVRGESCIMLDVQCDDLGCYPVPTCVPDETTTTSCTIVTCGPDCRFVTGEDLCPACDCPPTCMDVACDPAYYCIMQFDQCDEWRCYPVPTCIPYETTTVTTHIPTTTVAEFPTTTVTEFPTTTDIPSEETTTPCPLIRCAPDCVTETGSDGCPRCACPPSCQTVRCSAGYECQLVNVTCVRSPCFPQARCVAIKETTTRKECRKIRCLSTCFPGTGPDGCPSCDCPPTCQDYPCRYDEVCVLQDVRCNNKKKPCFQQPTCISKKESRDPEK